MNVDNRTVTDNKREILKQFRHNLQDLLTPDHTDAVLLKWLRSRNFDLKKAECIFRENAATRQMYGINNITETYVKPEVPAKYERTWFLGLAKDGTAVRYANLHADFSGFAHSVSGHGIIMYFCHQIESDIKAMKEQNTTNEKNIWEITYIFDFEDYSLQDISSKCVMEAFFDNFLLLQDHYPEIWRYVFVVNAPNIFDKILTFFKPVLRNTFLEKIKVASKSTTSHLLRKYIDDNVLPAFLGGTRVDSKGDPRCKEFIYDYSIVPEQYYLKNAMHLIKESDSGVTRVTIGARRVFNVPLVVRQQGVRIRLEMRTENGSVYFSVLLRNFGTDPENPELPEPDAQFDPSDESSNVRVVGTRIRIQSHIAPWDATISACWPGVYIFHFDNTSSWITSRKLFYRITVLPQDD